MTSLFDQITQPGTSTIIASAITALVSLQTVFLKWLIDSFKDFRLDLKTQALQTMQWLTEHEEKDMIRHEENLKRFETISIALAHLGHK